MNSFYDMGRLESEEYYVENLNLSHFSLLAAVLYFFHGLSFFLYAYNSFLIIWQIVSIIVCIGAFFANKYISTRVATIMLVVLVSISVNVWAYSIDVGIVMRWYILLALFPLSIFPIITRRDKISLTFLVATAFVISLLITYYSEPLVKMPNSELYNMITRIVIFVTIALELYIYSYINTRRDKGIERIETILNNVQCGIVIVDIQTHELIDINPTACQMFEGDKSQLVGKICHKLICPAQEGACPITDKNMKVDRSERLLVKADGTTIPIVKSVAKVKYGNRHVLLESFTDITNIKKAEEQLRRLEITEQSNRTKSEFLSRMSHEMRTPMNAIIGMAQIAERTDDVERLKYCLSMIDVSSTHLLGLINDVLDMSKIEAGKLELCIAPFSIEDVLTKVCHIMCEQVDKKHIGMQLSYTKEICRRYLGDELRLSQVITNLMSNAIKFTPENGSIHVTIIEAPGDPGFSLVRFNITDTGIGMTDEQTDRLFKAFEQADGGITRQYGGTGLGLAISKNIIEAMGGRIWVETELNRGSSFTFEIPLQHIESQDEKSPFDVDELNGLRILLLEPDEKAIPHFCSVAEWHGAWVDACEKEEDAKAYIQQVKEKQQHYDVIFATCSSSGTELLKRFDKLLNGIDKGSVVLMAQTCIWNEMENVAHNAGYKNFIPKPVLPSVFRKTILNIVAPGAYDESEAENDFSVPDFSGATVLLAEDMLINREIVIALLEDTHIEIDTAENGLEAVEKFQSSPDRYDLIFMDIQMPVMNGYDATKNIRSLDASNAKSVPIVAMSADAFKEDVEKCLAYGMNDHIKKPVELEIIIEKLSFYLNK